MLINFVKNQISSLRVYITTQDEKLQRFYLLFSKLGVKWFFSTNHKDIGILYFIFGLISAISGTFLSILIRIELAFPGNVFFSGNHQLYNVVVTSHAVVMIFFLLCL